MHLKTYYRPTVHNITAGFYDIQSFTHYNAEKIIYICLFYNTFVKSRYILITYDKHILK